MRVVVAVVVGLALTGGAVARAGDPPSAADLEAELVCPTCQTTLDQSDSPVARRMKVYIRERIAAGASAGQIKAELVDEFGPRVLAEPPKSGFDLLAWVLPLAVLGIGAVGVGAAAVAWSRRRPQDEEPGSEPLDATLERRLDDELARFDA